MEQQIINLINERINKNYLDIKILLLDNNSYSVKVDTQNVQLYFSFLEASLKQSYNRINAVLSFIVSNDGQLIDRMYPFALLREDTKLTIDRKFSQAVNLIDELEEGSLDRTCQLLRQEKSLEMNRP